MNPENKQSNRKKLIIGLVLILLATGTYFTIRGKPKPNALPVIETRISENKSMVPESDSGRAKSGDTMLTAPKKPKFPVKIKYRRSGKLPVKIEYQEASFFGSGNIVVIDNTSNKKISATIKYSNLKTHVSKSFKIVLKPGLNSARPVFYSGDKIVITSPEYESYEINVK